MFSELLSATTPPFSAVTQIQKELAIKYYPGFVQRENGGRRSWPQNRVDRLYKLEFFLSSFLSDIINI